MALSVGYVGRETASNLKRNMLMTVAAALTMAVSLVFVGATLLARQGVDKQAERWRGGVELSVFMRPDATDQQADSVRAILEGMPQVKQAKFVDKAHAYEEMKVLFANQPEVIEAVSPADAPPSFRVVPRKAELTEDIGNRVKNEPGVDAAVYAKDTIDLLIKQTNSKRALFLGFAVVVLVAATLLILNTVQMAIFSRRREVAVMKLVGATNWFIRIPFMLEGMVQGLIGAAAAFVVCYVARTPIMKFVYDSSLTGFGSLTASPGEAISTGIVLLIVGALVGAAGSAVAVARFLDV